MAADAWIIYDSFLERMADGGHDLDNDSFYMALYLSNSNCASGTLDQYSELDYEHSGTFGYTAGGSLLDNVTWVEAAGVVTFDADPEVWTASGGSILCRFAVIYNWTHANDLLVAFSLLDNTPADVEATDGNTLTITPNASGIFTLTQV
ncbi:MAG: hypothetical protein ACW99J_17545 [Candidatus Thorarchaeota archaeon]|jgi:hypothetical protein